MILIGTMNWPSTRGRGVFQCPECAGSQQYRLRVSRPFLTLYFIPVLPIGGLNEYVQCDECRSSFEPVVLDQQYGSNPDQPPEYDPENIPFAADLCNMIALIMVEDGHVTEAEISIARRVFRKITNVTISREELGHACSQVRLQQLSTSSYLATCVARRSPEEKILLLQAVFAVASVESEISPGRMESILKAKKILGVDDVDFEEAITGASELL
ncbi:MAG: zinc-ribbon domain-containing protein [Aureliella sp.]